MGDAVASLLSVLHGQPQNGLFFNGPMHNSGSHHVNIAEAIGQPAGKYSHDSSKKVLDGQGHENDLAPPAIGLGDRLDKQTKTRSVAERNQQKQTGANHQKINRSFLAWADAMFH